MFPRFIHIPRTAGMKVRADLLHLKSEEVNCEFAQMFLPDGNLCHVMHVPPYLLNATRESQERPTFCVVRHPESRIVSAFRYAMLGREALTGRVQCMSPESMNEFLQNLLVQAKEFPFTWGCFLVPQIDYILSPGRQNYGSAPCQNILRYEALEEELNAFMKSSGSNRRLRNQTERVNTHDSECYHFSVASLSPKTLELMHVLYKRDYMLFDLLADKSVARHGISARRHAISQFFETR